MAVPADDGIGNRGVAPDTTVLPHDRAGDVGLLLDLALLADDGVGADGGAGFHEHAFVDEAGSLDPGAILDTRILGHKGRPISVAAERDRLVAPVHDVAVHL